MHGSNSAGERRLSEKQRYVSDLISALPITRYLRSKCRDQETNDNNQYHEIHLHQNIHPSAVETHLLGGSLIGDNKLPIPPRLFVRHAPPEHRIVCVCYIGSHLTGHPGYVHGGLPFLLFDDIFARLAGSTCESGVAMTANMNIDFRKPCIPDRVYTIRAEVTRTEGRKTWLAATMRCLKSYTVDEMAAKECDLKNTLSLEEDEADIVAEGTSLFLEPKSSKVCPSIQTSPTSCLTSPS